MPDLYCWISFSGLFSSISSQQWSHCNCSVVSHWTRTDWAFPSVWVKILRRQLKTVLFLSVSLSSLRQLGILCTWCSADRPGQVGEMRLSRDQHDGSGADPSVVSAQRKYKQLSFSACRRHTVNHPTWGLILSFQCAVHFQAWWSAM